MEPPIKPPMSHIQNGSMVLGARNDDFDAKDEWDRKASRKSVKVRRGEVELIPQPSSSSADPLVCPV